MNFLEKSRAQQLTHGLPNKPRQKESSMFDILSWIPDNKSNVQNSHQQHRLHQHGYYTEDPNNLQHETKQNCQHCPNHQVQTFTFDRSPHKIKHELYTYNDEDIKAKKIVQTGTQNLIQKLIPSPDKKVQFYQKSKSKSLNPNNSADLLEIQSRKKKIKNFKMLSRELPDSAFTTYFGKPAFANYGCGSTSKQKKTFNIMPHAGQNHPEYQQSYDTALRKGKQIQPHQIPRKPIEMYKPSEEQMQNSDYYQIPIKKPNLIQTVRFTEDKSYLERKARTPKHNELNPVRSRQSLHNNFHTKTSKDSEKKKLKKVKSMKTFQNFKNDHPLVNNRDHLREILEEKKRQDNKLAYKVTECYPLPYENCGKTCQTNASRWTDMRPAGITSPRSDHARDVFYPNNLWN